MVIDPYAREAINNLLDAYIKEQTKNIISVLPAAATDGKENAMTWWMRGQITALERIKAAVNNKDDSE